MSKRDANLAKCTEHDSKQRTIADCLCTRLVQLLLSQNCLWTRLVHLLLSQLSCGRVVQALLSRKAPVFKEGWVAFQPVFEEGWTAFQQLAFKAGRLFSSWPFDHFANNSARLFLHVAHALAQFFFVLKLCNGCRFRARVLEIE